MTLLTPATLLLLFLLLGAALAAGGQPLPGTQPLTAQGDLAAEMVAGIDRALMRELDASIAGRAAYWNRDFTSHDAYLRAVAPNRERLRRMLGLVDAREPVALRLAGTVGGTSSPEAALGVGAGYKIYAVRWNVLDGVEAEGLLLQPARAVVADVVALPDCDSTPESLVGLEPGVPKAAQFARRLAENGCRVLVPFLLDRRDTYSGVPGVRMTNLPHREFVYRAAFELGRHVVGYEIQKVLAAVDWFRQEGAGRGKPRPLGVMGYGEGGLLAFYAAAVDTRIDAACVSGYFQPRERLWNEPIYRNVFGLLREFGDAEIASLIAPRALVIEASRQPNVSGPPPAREGRSGAAPGEITTPDVNTVLAELSRARTLISGLKNAVPLTLVDATTGTLLIPYDNILAMWPGKGNGGQPGADLTLITFLQHLGRKGKPRPSGSVPKRLRKSEDPDIRLKRQFDQIMAHIQRSMREAEYRRADFWKKADATSATTWAQTSRPYRDYFWEEVIGKLPPATVPISPRSRLVYDTPKYRGYEVTLEVYPDVFAYGILLVPKDIPPGERRAVVVCQHGLEGRPQDVADPNVENQYYHQYACKLAEEGFVTFAPQNPYIGETKFRVLQRKAHPLKQSLFAFIVRQHEQILNWLGSLPFVDDKRIAFYGLSYGGKTAMRVPALLEKYCLSICSADYNEWIWKNVSDRSAYSYLLTVEHDMVEFDLGNTFNYAEMSWLICPRPFMVERGHHDGVAPDEWVAYEYAKTRRRYVLLGLGDRTEIEFFNGPHSIHGVGTFAFLRKHLGKP